MENCDKCGNRRVLPTENGYRRCSCVEGKQIKTYLKDIGKIKLPPDWIKEKVDSLPTDKSFAVDFPATPLNKFNGAIAHQVMKVYPEDYDCYNIYEMYESMKDKGTFSDIYGLKKPYLVLTGGLPEEHEAMVSNGEQWTKKVYGNTAQQIFGYRLRRGLHTWFFTINNPYDNVEGFLQEQDVDIIKARNTKSNNLGAI